MSVIWDRPRRNPMTLSSIKLKMHSPYDNTAIVFGDLKEALLYYDYVIPMNFTGQFMGLQPDLNGASGSVTKTRDPEMGDYNDLVETFGDTERLRSLYPPELAKSNDFAKILNTFDGLLFGYMIKSALGDEAYEEYRENVTGVTRDQSASKMHPLQPWHMELQYLFSAIIGGYKLGGVIIDCSHFYFGGGENARQTNAILAHAVIMIDADKLTCSQIMNFRKDRETMKKMRNFRLFAYENYNGKDKAFVEDDIQRRYDEYLEAVRSSGFETTIKTLSSLIESKILMGAFSTCAMAALIGNPSLAISAFGSGVLLELGKLSLEYAQHSHEIAKITSDNPISYIENVRRKLES